MRIDHTSGPGRPAALRSRRRQDGFALPDDSSTQAEASGPAAPAEAAAALSTIHAAPSAEQAAQDDAAAARQGEQMLDALAELQLAALSGDRAAAAETLAGLSAGLRATDPRLDAVLQGIAARAAVELARPR